MERKIRTQRAGAGHRGFTLVELVIVIAVLAVLAVIAIPTVSNVIENAKTAAARTNVRNIDDVFKIAMAQLAAEGTSPTYGPEGALTIGISSSKAIKSQITPKSSENQAYVLLLRDAMFTMLSPDEKFGYSYIYQARVMNPLDSMYDVWYYPDKNDKFDLYRYHNGEFVHYGLSNPPPTPPL